jgi:hypothetical protein
LNAPVPKVIWTITGLSTSTANCVNGDILLLSWQSVVLRCGRFHDRNLIGDITFFRREKYALLLQYKHQKNPRINESKNPITKMLYHMLPVSPVFQFFQFSLSLQYSLTFIVTYNDSYIPVVTSGTGTTYPSGAHEFIPGVRFVMLNRRSCVDHHVSLCPFCFLGHCFV